MRYSQNNEQDIITEYFKDQQGKFLDIGAYNGRDLSNTYQLALNGWHGVLIEPSPRPFVDLMNLYCGNDNAILINAAIDTKEIIVEFYDSIGDAVSSTEKDHFNKWKDTARFQPFLLQTMSLESLKGVVGVSFDFISIDTEGSSFRIFEMVCELFNFEMICMEHDNNVQQARALARRKGFKELLFNAENLIFAR